MKKIKNKKRKSIGKKADLLPEDTAKFILEIVALVIISSFVISAVIFFWPFNKNLSLNQAIDQLEKTKVRSEQVYKTGERAEIDDFFPPKTWFLRTFADNDFPIGECRKSIGCLCICEGVNCDDKNNMRCQGFNFEIRVDSDFGSKTGAMRLNEIEILDVYKEGDVIKIKRKLE
ncbi:MAG: hypothetical protein ABIH37_05650 [archaeon]